MDIASFANVPDWPRGCIQGVQGVVKPETGFEAGRQTIKAGQSWSNPVKISKLVKASGKSHEIR
jgi:hypothetical protein